MPKFIGGVADGKLLEIQKCGGRYPLVQYVAHRLSMNETDELMIDNYTGWKPPEDVYYLKNGDYVFDRTVRYKP